ncbi:peptidylprolyl isomerase [Niastella koreensis]|uniref:Peptidyl-prolyl cis-trans isomerase n=2 Tax=Niastella koreensis TaxID=354356 RepID=G8TQ83_NIAKG|nr:peptidylprolyl isomerase [Niastella koreensis]AEW02097.1 peptidyl-prolyl cis-trans isomerase cyclophilin type [Niastella koreensis GR20-10]OQP48785.1 peptidylprolyl isomerase [Niastella koreensis]
MRNQYLFILAISLLMGACSPKYKNPHIEIQTSKGEIELELYPDQAPKTVQAFLAYIKKGYYKNSSFYRVLNDDNQPSNADKAELIQGGMYKSMFKVHDTLTGIPHESTLQTHLLHKKGTISLARLAPGTATSEFFICLSDQPGFDYGGENNPDKQGYAAFGKVIKGMDIVTKIYNQNEDNQSFDPPVPIYNIIQL